MGHRKKSANKKSENGAAKKAPESTGEDSKASVAKQVSPDATEPIDSKSKKNAAKAKPSAKASKPVEAAEKKERKAGKSKAWEKKGVKAPKADEVDDADAPSVPDGKTNRQTKKKQKQKQQQQQQQQQQPTADIAAAPAVVADTSSSSKKKKKKAAAAEKRRNSLGAAATITKQSSPSNAPSKKSKEKASMERERSFNEMSLTPSTDSEFAKSMPNIRSFDGSNSSSPEAAPIAPPPGLAPPPGFLSTKEKDAGLPAPLPDDASLSNLSQIPLDGGVGAPSGLGGLGGTELWLGGNASSPLGRDKQEGLSGLHNDQPLGTSGNTDGLPFGGTLPLLDQASPGFLRGRPLLGGSGGFNVQSFLDTILDESEMVEDDFEEDDRREDGVGGSPLALGSGPPGANDGLAAAIATATAIGGRTSDLLVPQRFGGVGGVSSDPWSSQNISSSSALPTAPLLTPEQILRENDAADAEEKNKKEEDGSHLMALFGASNGEDK